MMRLPSAGPIKWRYRFTFIQKLFLGHLAVSGILLLLLAFVWYSSSKQHLYVEKRAELISFSKAVIRILQKEDDPKPSLLSYRSFLNDRGISFYLYTTKGDQVYRDATTAPPAMSSKEILGSLRLHIGTFANDQTFEIERGTSAPYIVLPHQFRSKAKEDLVLYVTAPAGNISDAIVDIRQSIGYTLGAALLLAVFISWLLSRGIAKRIGSLRAATRQIAEGNLAARSQARSSDELGELSRDFNSMAETLEQTSHQLDRYEARRKQFIADVTHELRTPLTSIRGIIEAFKTGLVTDPAEQNKYYGIIEKETFRLIRLINELLDTEKVQNGMVALEKDTHSLRELFEVVAETLELSIERNQLAIRIECEPGVAVFGDYDRLMQILINLARNAAQFTEYGTIRLIGREAEGATSIEVTDTGRGMSPEELVQIWDRFYKADPSRAKDRGESGLGLSIVKQLVLAHGGTIEAKSELGIGTTFRLLLPLSSPAVAPEGSPE